MRLLEGEVETAGYYFCIDRFMIVYANLTTVWCSDVKAMMIATLAKVKLVKAGGW